MGRVSIKFNSGDPHVLENSEGPYSQAKRREERRWKRRQHILNEGSKHNCFARATRVNVKSCGNKAFVADSNVHMVEDDNNVHTVESKEDEDYVMFLDTLGSRIDVESNNDQDSNTDVGIVYSSGNDDGAIKYKMFLENLRRVGKSYIASVSVHNQLVELRYEGEVEEEEEEEEEEGEPTGNTMESKQSLETERGPLNKRKGSDVSRVSKTNCNTEVEINNVDEDYQKFLNLCRIDSGSLVYEVRGELKRKTSCVNNDSQVSDQAFRSFKVQCDIHKEEQIGNLMESQQSLETERGPMNNCNAELEVDSVGYDDDYKKILDSYNSQVSDQAFDTPKSNRGLTNNCNAELEDDNVNYDEDYKKLLDSYNSQVSVQAFDTPKSQSDYVDEDYQLFLNSMITDANVVEMQDRSIKKTYEGDSGSNSSDTDLILLEPNQIGEDTPFILSKIYHWFENETNPGDSRHFSSNDHSEFRKRLMKDLERPYNREEHDQFLDKVHHKRQKERHVETRQGDVKRYLVRGLNKSYLELYPDLANAIAEFKEPHKVLFLLRGFFFWLQNVTLEERFKPWTDKSCLEILQKI